MSTTPMQPVVGRPAYWQLRRIREAFGLTVEELADNAGITVQEVRATESSLWAERMEIELDTVISIAAYYTQLTRNVGAEDMRKIREAFGLTVEELADRIGHSVQAVLMTERAAQAENADFKVALGIAALYTELTVEIGARTMVPPVNTSEHDCQLGKQS